MKTLSFFAAGIPKGQPRAKACIRGKHAGVYDPGTADDWKAVVRHKIAESWDKQPFTGPVSVTLRFWFQRPKAHFDSKGHIKPSAPNCKTSKPDLDNLAKAVMDAATNAGVLRDDAQVVNLTITKRYDDAAPGCDVTIEEVEL